MDWQAFGVSLQLGLCTTLILLFIGLPFAAGLVFGRWPFRRVIETVFSLPIVLPPTVLGFYLLVFLSPNGPAGKHYSTFTDGQILPFSFIGILIGSIVYCFPFAFQSFIDGFSAIDRNYLEAARALGATPVKTFFLVILPMAKRSILTGMILAFAHTLGEFGIVLMLGGNIPGQTRTLSVAIYDEVQTMNYQSAHHASLILIGISFLILWTLRKRI